MTIIVLRGRRVLVTSEMRTIRESRRPVRSRATDDRASRGSECGDRTSVFAFGNGAGTSDQLIDGD